ncbi:hypothetical protein TB1_013760 [Malus domestica]
MLLSIFFHFLSNKTGDNTNCKVRKKDGNLEGLGEAFPLSKVVNDTLKLSDSDFVAIVDPIVELWNHIQARVFERADFVVEGQLLGPAHGVVILAETSTSTTSSILKQIHWEHLLNLFPLDVIERVRVVFQADVQFIMELEHIWEYVSAGGVETSFSAPPKGLKIVLHRLLRIGPDQ